MKFVLHWFFKRVVPAGIGSEEGCVWGSVRETESYTDTPTDLGGYSVEAEQPDKNSEAVTHISLAYSRIIQ